MPGTNLLKDAGDISSFAAAVSAVIEAGRDENDDPSAAHSAALVAAVGTLITSGAVVASDLVALENTPWGGALKAAGLVALVANIEAVIADGQVILDDIHEGKTIPTNVLIDLGLSVANSVVTSVQMVGEVTGQEEIALGAATLSALLSLAQVSNSSGIDSAIWHFIAPEAEAETVGVPSNQGVVGANTVSSDGTIVTSVVVKIDTALHLLDGSGYAFGALSTDSKDILVDKLNNQKSIVGGIEIAYSGSDPTPLVVDEGASILRTYTFGSSVIQVNQSTENGQVTLSVGNSANTSPITVGNYTHIDFVVGSNGSPDEVILSAPGASTGTLYQINGTDGSLSSPVTVPIAPVVGKLGSSVGFNINYQDAAPEIGSIIGSSLGNLLSNGNQVEGVVYSGLIGTLGQDVAAQLVGNKDAADALPTASAAAFSSYLGQVGSQIVSGGAGLIGNTLFMELGQDLGLSNFGAQLLGNVGSTVASKVASNVLAGGLSSAFNGFSAQNIFSSQVTQQVGGATKVVQQAGAGTLAVSAVASFLGSALGNLVVSPQTQAAGYLSSLGSSIGSWALTTTSLGFGSGAAGTSLGVSLFGDSWWAANIIAPGVGAFIGFVLGALIGNLFGHKKPEIPTAGAQTVLNLPYAQYKLGSVTSTNGGSTNEVVEMAQTAAETLNGIIAEVTGGGVTPHFVANSSSPTQAYGYTGSQLYVELNGTQYNVSSADQAVDKGVLWALPQTEIIGGDLFVKRAIKNANATDLNTLTGDIQTAKDYENYLSNETLINSYITGAYASLTQAQQNFYANNKALVDAADMGGVGSLNSAQMAIYDANTQTITDIIAAVKNQSIANPWLVTLENVNGLGLNQWSSSDFYGGLQGFLQSFGMGQVDSTANYEGVKLGWDGTNLTITDAAAPGLFSVLDQASPDGTSVVIDNFNTVMSGSAGVGWNILIGGNSGNNLTASDTDTWIQGGAGTDVLRGGGGHDVIVAGSGSTTIYGGSGASYLAAGSANGDQVFGGSGNDTIYAGTGLGDTLSAVGSNNTFILSGISGSGSIVGGGVGTGNNNTISFERYSSGVNVNLGDWAAGAGNAYSETDIQNLIGSAAGGNTLETGASGGTLEGGAGNDTFIGGGGTTTVSFANSGSGVYVDLSTGTSFGGVSNGDTFQNIQNVFGSAFDDDLKGVAGSTLNGGGGGDDIFEYSGGGNSYIGSQGGTNTLDYSEAPAAVTVNFTTDVAQVSGETADSISNITRLIGSPDGTSVTAFPGSSQTISSTGAQLTSTQTGLGLYFIPTGGTNTLISNGSDTVELDSGGGQTTVTAGVLGYMDNTIAFGSGTTYDDIWVSMQLNESTTQSSGVGGGGGGLPGKPGSGPGQFQTFSSYNWTWGIRGGSDEVIFKSSYSSNPTSETVHDSTPTTLDMDGASTLDLSGIEFVIGETITNSSSGGTTTQTRSGGGSSQTFASTVNGYDGGSSVIITGGQASIINVDGGAAVTNGSVVIAGQAGSAGIAINTSSGDDQITYERGDGKYTITGTGGQKTIDFGPSVGSDDVIYRVIGNDLYIGLQDLSNTALTADQVSDSIRIVGGANYTANPYYIEVAGSTINLSTLTTIDWTGGSVNVTEMTTNNSSVAVSNTTVNVNSGLTGLVQGNTDTINAGTGSTITVNGTGNTVNSESGSVTLSAANASLTLVGAGNTLSATGSGDTLVVYGDGTTVSANGTAINDESDTMLTISGASDNISVNVGGATVTSSGNTIFFSDSNLTGTINGTGNSIADYGGDALTVTNSGNTTYLRSSGSSVSTSTSNVTFDTANVSGSVNGNGDNVNITATGVTETLTGSGDITWIQATNAVVDASNTTTAIVTANVTATISGSGNSDFVRASGDVLNDNGATVVFDTASVSASVNATYDNIEITGTNVTETLTGVGDINWISATGAVVNASNSTTVIDAANVAATVNGSGNNDYVRASGDTLVANSSTLIFDTANVNAAVNGNADTVNVTGAGITVNADLTNSTLNGSNFAAFLGAANTTDTVSSGSGDTVFVRATGVTLNTSNTVTVFDLANETDTIAGSGNGDYIRAGGITLNASNSSINFDTANVSASVNGSSDTINVSASGTTISTSSSVINLSGTGETLTLNGAGNTINAGTGNTLNVTGDWEYGSYNYVSLSSGTLNLSANSNSAFTGSNNQINVGNGSLLNVQSGNANTVSAGISDNLWTSGTNGTFSATNSTLTVNVAGATESVSGTGNVVVVYQGNDTINASNTAFQFITTDIGLVVSGNNDTISLESEDAIYVYGTGDVLSGNTYNLALEQNSTTTTVNGGTAVTAYVWATGDTLSMSNNTAVFNVANVSGTISGSGNSDYIRASGVTLNAGNSNVYFDTANVSASVNGNSDTIDLTQAGDTLDVAGAGNTINAGTGNTITLTGDTEYGSYNYVYLSSGTFNLSANSNSILNGSNNQVTVGNGSLLNVNSGNANTVSAGSSENIWTSGTNGTFLATNSTVTVNVAGATESVSGTGDTVAIYQSGDTINVSNSAVTFMSANIAATIVGANNTASITTSGDTLNLSGSGDNVTLSSGGTINLTNGTSLTVHGTGVTVNASNATIYEGNTSTVTVNGTGDTIVHLGVAPIVFDLNGDGLELTPVGASDVITTASNGALTRLGWVGPTDGVLVTDRSGNGQYNSVQDISFTQDLAGAQTDLEGLAGWDTNGDGVINAQDAGWSKLKIWVDSNGDGVVESGELYSLAQLGITSINLTRTLTGVDPTDTSDSYDSATSTFTRSDGSTGTTYDVTLGQQVLAAPGWQSSTASTWGPLTNLGQIGALSNAQAARLGTTTAGDINYTGINGLDPATAAIWSDFLTPAADAARKAAQATGQIGDTSWMQSSSVSVTDPNRGATNVTTQRFQVLDLDLTGAGPTTVESAASAVKLDVNLTGTPYSTGWVGPSDGLLVVDAAGDGNIDAATEATFQSWVPYAKTSLQGLAAFDTNGDGMIDAGDAVFNNLRIWTDSNGDGVSEPGELQSLSQLGIQSISLKSDTATVDDKQLDENEILTTSTVTMVDGTARTLYDIALGVDTGQDTSSPTSPTTPTSTPAPASDPSSGLAAASDASAAAASTTTPSDTLHTPLNSASAGVSAASAGSAGPSGDVVVADAANASTTNGWWDNSSGQSLSDAINSFNAPSHATNGSGAPTTEAIDAAMIQRHLLLRQAIAGFTIQGSAPAVFARQGSLDTQATLAAATTSQTVTSPASIPAGIAA